MILRRMLIGGMAAFLAALLTLSLPAAKAGTPLNTSFIVSDQANPLEHPAVAYSGLHQEHLVVWCDSSASVIYGRKVPKNGPLGPLLTISGTNPGYKHCYPDVAYNTQQDSYLIVWEFNSYSGGSYDNVQGRLLYSNGNLSGDLLFGTGPALRNRTKPRVDYGYTSDLYMVVWEAQTQGALSSDIEGQVVNANGTKSGSNFMIAQGTTSISHDQPDLAFNISRNEYLVAWRRHDTNGPNDDIFGQIVTRDAVLLGNQLLIGFFTPPELSPSVAALQSPAPQSGIYLVAWQLQYAPGDNDIYARLVGGDGILGTMVEMTGTASRLDETHPVVAADLVKRRFLGLWTSAYNTGFLFTGLRGRDITSDGLSGPIHWIDGVFADHAAAAPGVSGDFLVVYDEFKLGSNLDIYGRRWGSRLYIPLARR